MEFLDPSIFGPLFRFNREFYRLDERGKPEGYRSLDILHERIRPCLLRRRKSDVETELPERTDKTRFVPLSEGQRIAYGSHEHQVTILLQIAEQRPLRKEEQDKLQRELAMMRMICDTNYILDAEDRVCPKLKELQGIIEDCREEGAKLIVFSEWSRMLELVRERCDTMGVKFAWHTGKVPQKRRRAEIQAFKKDPECLVFLSTDSGATGLNLQIASVVVNCDLPWNPAKLEQRIARAWRKHQTKPVTVINLVSEDTIEHSMLGTLAKKRDLSDAALDRINQATEISLRRGGSKVTESIKRLIGTSDSAGETPDSVETPPAKNNRQDRYRPRGAPGLALDLQAHLGSALVACEERIPEEGAHSVVVAVVERDASIHKATLNSDLPILPDDPLAPTKLEAIERLIDAGLLTRTDRATIPLLDNLNDKPAPAPLSPEEKARIEENRQEADRNLKMARLLGSGGFDAETRAPLLAALRHSACCLAIKNRLPEPENVEACFQAPLHRYWNAPEPLAEFAHSSDASSWPRVADQLANEVAAC